LRRRHRFLYARRLFASFLAGQALIAGAQPALSDPLPALVPRLPVGETPCFTLVRIELEGEAADKFDWSLDAADQAGTAGPDPALHRCLGRVAIVQVIQRIQAAIIARGFVTTRVLASEQDLSTGVLRLTIVPGRLCAARVRSDTPGRGTLWNALPTAPGALLNLRDIEQTLENLQRPPTVEADIQIAPCEPQPGGSSVRPGNSELSVQWKQRLPFRLGLSIDDSGTRASGRYQGALTLSYDNALNLNDLLYVSVVQNLPSAGDDIGRGEHGTYARTAHYSLPFRHWLLAFNARSNRFHQSVAGITQSYVYRGESSTQDVHLSRLVHRDAVTKSHVFLRGWSRQSRNFIDDTEVEVQRRRTAGWDLGAQHHQRAGQAAWDLTLTYRRGTGAWGALAAPEDAFGEGASRPRITSADVSFVLPLRWGEQHGRYRAAAAAQWTQQALVPNDRFAIGGRHTVRGFDGERALSAARGAWLRQELGWRLVGSGQELYLGVDHGQVGGGASESLVGTRLTGAVIGWRGGYRQASWEAFVGRPLKKPVLFRTADSTTGFSLNVSF
jgi:hemolysin activation/secretion protein